MAVFRVHKDKNYTVISNLHLRDRELSLKAKGLLTLMLSLPDDWDYSLRGLCTICKENETAIKSALSELKEHGYLIIQKLMPNETENGRIGYEYHIYEQKQEGEKQGVENQPLEIQPVENQVQLNTKEQSTKERNTEEQTPPLTPPRGVDADASEREPKKKAAQRFTPPTIDEVRTYCAERDNGIDAEEFCDFYASKGWMVGKNKMKDWMAAVRTWERAREKEQGRPSKPKPNEIRHKGFYGTFTFPDTARWRMLDLHACLRLKRDDGEQLSELEQAELDKLDDEFMAIYRKLDEEPLF